MPYIKSNRPCVKCGAITGTLWGIEGQRTSPDLCARCFQSGKGVVERVASWIKGLR
jgi:hypothetical protein